jgi:hypothetical protein
VCWIRCIWVYGTGAGLVGLVLALMQQSTNKSGKRSHGKPPRRNGIGKIRAVSPNFWTYECTERFSARGGVSLEKRAKAMRLGKSNRQTWVVECEQASIPLAHSVQPHPRRLQPPTPRQANDSMRPAFLAQVTGSRTGAPVHARCSGATSTRGWTARQQSHAGGHGEGYCAAVGCHHQRAMSRNATEGMRDYCEWRPNDQRDESNDPIGQISR